MATTVVVSANTKQLLERAVAKLDVLGHRIVAAEIREAQERKDTRARADAAAYLTSREHMPDLQATQRECQRRADDALQPWGARAPAPIAGESVDECRLRLASLVHWCKNVCPKAMNIAISSSAACRAWCLRILRIRFTRGRAPRPSSSIAL